MMMFQPPQRQLRYNTTVIYNNKIGIIKSVSRTNSVKIETDGRTEDVEKNKLKTVPNDINDVIEYNKNYYTIKDISLENNIPVYHCGFDGNAEIIEVIKSTDSKIKNVDKKEQEQKISYLKFMERYNSTVEFLNKRKNKNNNEYEDDDYEYYSDGYEPLDRDNIEDDMCDLFERCKLKMSQLNKIENTLKKTHNPKLQIQNIYVNPFDFITQEYQLISYDKAEKISNEYMLTVDFKIKIEKWSYDFFLRDKNTFYIVKWLYLKEMEKFCNERGQKSKELLKYIETIIVDKKISSEIYKTTQYFIDFEKNLTDLIMDLYYDKEYDIDIERINEKINNYEGKTRKERSLNFALEPEQREAVITSVRNKLSIIVGPPGTGKTEILKCINYVIRELYKDNEYKLDENSNKYINSQKIGLVAPTGLAYVNMQRKQEISSYCESISGTCHRLLYNTVPNIKKHKYKCNCPNNVCKFKNLEIKLVELDEASMLDIFVFNDLLKQCKYFNSRLIILGDVDQLPSIGPGKVLFHLVKSNVFNVTRLTKIKRQNAGSLVNCIIEMSKNIVIAKNHCKDDSIVMKQVESFIDCGKINQTQILNLVEENGLNENNSIFIVGFNKTTFTFNTAHLNNMLQDVYNPVREDDSIYVIPSKNKYDNSIFRVNDKIIRTENDYSDDKMRANGETAKILYFDGKKVTIEYSDSKGSSEEIGINELYENFMLNYCITVHKSQGSQYPNVVFIIEPKQTIIEKKTIYTAISRAENRCVIISNQYDFVNLQKNNKKLNMKVSIFMEESNTYEL